MDLTGQSAGAPGLQVNALVSLLASPTGVICLGLFLMLLIAMFVVPPARWIALAVLLVTSSTAAPADMQQQLLLPLRLLTLYGRGITAGLLVALLIPTVTATRGWRGRSTLGATGAFLLFELLAAARSSDPVRFGLSIVTFGLIYASLGTGLGRWLQTDADAQTLARTVSLGGVLFMAGTLAQVVVDRSQVTVNGRLFGITGNPNHCGVLLAITLLPTLYLLTRRGRWGPGRLVTAAVAGLMVLLLLWTGSRTGDGMALVGVAVMFRRRLGALALASLLCGAVAFFAWDTVGGLQDSASRAFSFENTRSFAWASMWNQFLSSPVIGVPIEQAGFSENSYLLVAARTGLLGLVPLLVATAMAARAVVRLWRASRRLREVRGLVDLTLGTFVAVLCGSFFEGYLYGVYNLPVLAVYIYLTLTAFLLDRDAAGTVGAASQPAGVPAGTDPLDAWIMPSA